MTERPQALTAEQIDAGLAELPQWSGDGTGIARIVEAPSFLAGIELVRQVAIVAEEMNHHPDIDVRWRKVRFSLVTHDAGGVSELDMQQARRIDSLAAELQP